MFPFLISRDKSDAPWSSSLDRFRAVSRRAHSTRYKGPLVFTSLNAVIEWMRGGVPLDRRRKRPRVPSPKGTTSSPLYRATRATREARKRRGEDDSVTIAGSTAAIIFKHAAQIGISPSTEGERERMLCLHPGNKFTRIRRLLNDRASRNY